MKCIKCNLHKDNNDPKWLNDKLEEAKKNLEDYKAIKNPNDLQSSQLEYFKNHIKILEKIINCDHKFK